MLLINIPIRKPIFNSLRISNYKQEHAHFYYFKVLKKQLNSNNLFGSPKILVLCAALILELLRVVPARTALFESLLVFFYSKNFKLANFLEGFHLRIALNSFKYTPFLCHAMIFRTY